MQVYEKLLSAQIFPTFIYQQFRKVFDFNIYKYAIILIIKYLNNHHEKRSFLFYKTAEIAAFSQSKFLKARITGKYVCYIFPFATFYL